MSKESLIKRICCSLGENNHPTYAVMAIALFKGILRPTFTMMDKKQDPESKRYAAFREGVTEAIAFPTYYIFGKLADKLAPKFLDKNKLGLDEKNLDRFNSVLKKPHKEFKSAADVLKNEGDTFKTAFKQYKIVGETTSFLGVCIAALLVIPSLCNVALPPIMKGFKKWQDSKKQNTIQPQNINFDKIADKPNIYPPIAKPDRQNALEIYQMSKGSAGMRVGN